MPGPVDQVPGGVTALAQKVAKLERDVRELRAAKRAAHTTVENGRVVFTADSGWSIVVDPSDELPSIAFYDANGNVMGVMNALGDPELSALVTASGPFDDGNRVWRWFTILGELTADNDVFSVGRAAEDDADFIKGGRLLLREDLAEVSYQDPDASYTNVSWLFSPSYISSSGKIIINPAFTATPALQVWDGSVTPVFQVDQSGNLSTAGQILGQTIVVGSGTSSVGGDLNITGSLGVGATTWTSYTPTVTNGGSATFGTQDGWYYKLGKLVYVEAYVTVSGAGSGTSNIAISLPSTPYRGPSSNRRQVIPCYAGGISTNAGPAAALVLATGSGAQVDQIQNIVNGAVQGGQLTTSSIITFNGWYREA